MKKLGQILFVFVVFLTSCSEQLIDDTGIGTVKGRVVNSQTFEPIGNAKISSNPTSNTTFTDKDGYFVIDAIGVGKYSFQAQKDGFIAKFEPGTVTKNTTTQVAFELDISTANNKPPGIPVLTAPLDLAINQTLKLNFTWTAVDLELDPLTYILTLKNATTDEVTVFKDIITQSLEISGLKYSTKYYWQIAASDGINTAVNSVTNSFTTLAFPNPRFLYVRKINTNNVIFTADDLGNELQLTASQVNSYRPIKNLQATKIAFISSDGSQNQIYTMNPDGTSVFKVTNSIPIGGFNLEYVNYCWNTNGSQIIYPNFDKLYRINANGSGLVPLFQTPNGKFISECDWSQDGSQIVLKVNDLSGYNVEIYVINPAGELLYSVLSGLNGAVSGLNISANNQKIIYTRDVSGNQNTSYRRFDSRILIYDKGTNTSTELTTIKATGFNDLDVKFSPNEAEIIFTSASNDGISGSSIMKTGINIDARTILFNGGSMPDWK